MNKEVEVRWKVRRGQWGSSESEQDALAVQERKYLAGSPEEEESIQTVLQSEGMKGKRKVGSRERLRGGGGGGGENEASRGGCKYENMVRNEAE